MKTFIVLLIMSSLVNSNCFRSLVENVIWPYLQIANLGDFREKVSVTFNLDMNNYDGDFENVYVSGTFNNWHGTLNKLVDDDGDGIYSVTRTMYKGINRYIFQLDNYSVQEVYEVGDECTRTTVYPQGQVFTDRLIDLNEDVILPIVCWESCYACDQSVDITWIVEAENFEVNNGIYVGGSSFAGQEFIPVFAYDEAEKVHTLTINREVGFSTSYVFMNGNCHDNLDCVENLKEQECESGVSEQRFLSPVMKDTIVYACFGQCSLSGLCSNTSSSNTLLLDQDNPSFRVYPTSSRDLIIVEWSVENLKSVTILDNFGKIISQNRLSPSNTDFKCDVSNFMPGIYLVRLDFDDKFYIERVFVH